jgi:DNA-binding NtrC family response regulator
MVMQVISFNDSVGATISSQTATAFDSEIIRESLIGISRWTETARRLLALHAAHDRPVILEGEGGTGKEFFARLIHRSSSRREGPFLSLAVGSTSDEVARAVLFGSTQVRQDGVLCREKGLAELAQGGTLYISGLSGISSSLTDDIIQLAERRGFDADGEKPVRVLLGWSSQSEPYPSGTFTGPANFGYERIQIPPLRERPDDIEVLAEHFVHQLCRQMGKEVRKISPEARKALRRYDWPRNVSELRILMNQLVRQLTPPSIDVSLLPAYLLGPEANKGFLPSSGLVLENEVRRVEVDLICAALKQSRGLQSRAAQLLRVKPTTLFMKIRRYGIDVEAFR